MRKGDHDGEEDEVDEELEEIRDEVQVEEIHSFAGPAAMAPDVNHVQNVLEEGGDHVAHEDHILERKEEQERGAL
eukprot:1251830-Rhodomonas_salina.1